MNNINTETIINNNKNSLYLNSFMAIVNKEITRIFRIWKQTLLPPIITQSLYFVIFGTFVGSRVSGDFNGLTYIQFLVPGLVMMAIIMNSFTNVVSSFYGAKFQKNVEEILISPTPNWVILAGFCSGGIIRGLLVGLIVFVISFLFVKPTIMHAEYILIFSIITSSLFSLIGFFNSLFAKSFDDVQIIPTFVLTPLTYLGGVFYLTSQLPISNILGISINWQTISRLNPIVYMIDGFRYGFYGTNEFPIILSLGIVGVSNLVFVILNLYLLKKGYGLKS